MLGIVTALKPEAKCISKQSLPLQKPVALNANTLLIISGMGYDNAKAASESLIKAGANRLLSFGTAGALSPNCKPGDLILANKIITADSKSFEVNHVWQQQIKKLMPEQIKPFEDPILHSDKIISGLSEKNKLYQTTKAIAVDMESYAVIETAHETNIPGLITRVIIDTVDVEIPGEITECMSEFGDAQLSKILALLVKHPSKLSALIKLAKHFNIAKTQMTILAKCINRI